MQISDKTSNGNCVLTVILIYTVDHGIPAIYVFLKDRIIYIERSKILYWFGIKLS